MKSSSKVKDWVASINDAGLRPPEGWCHPHRFGSFAPPRGLTEDGSQAQWFIDGRAAFEAIASAIEDAKSEVCSFQFTGYISVVFHNYYRYIFFCVMIESSMQIFICGWWVCPELYLRRPFHAHASSKLDSLLEAKAKEGVQVNLTFMQSVTLILDMFFIYDH